MSKKLFKGITIIGTIVGIIVGVFQIMEFFKVQNKETTTIIDNTSLQKIPEGFKETKSELKNKLQSNDIKLEDNGVINQGVIGNINNNRNLNYTNIQNNITDNNVKNIKNKNTQINQKNIKNDTKDNKDLIKEKIYEKQEKIIGELEEFKENYSYWDDKKIEDAYEKLKQNIKMNFNVTEELGRLDKQRYGMRVFPKPTAKEMIDRIRKTHWDSLSEAMKKEQKEELKK